MTIIWEETSTYLTKAMFTQNVHDHIHLLQSVQCAKPVCVGIKAKTQRTKVQHCSKGGQLWYMSGHVVYINSRKSVSLEMQLAITFLPILEYTFTKCLMRLTQHGRNILIIHKPELVVCHTFFSSSVIFIIFYEIIKKNSFTL